MKSLRSSLRRQRAALSAAEVAALSERISRHLWKLPLLSRCRRIACYSAVGGEVDCTAILMEGLARGRSLYLPVLHGAQLLFAPWEPSRGLVANRFGIAEPADAGARWLRGSALDVVLAPLVAFDETGHRLGMGGGFYDRSFAFLAQRGDWRHPHFIGLAYDFQRVAALSPRHWDVRLHGVVTESGARFF